MKRYSFVLLSLFFSLNISAVNIGNDSIYDGPYIFKKNDTFIVKWIENNILKEDSIMSSNYEKKRVFFNLKCDFTDLLDVYLKKSDHYQNYNNIDSFIAISDIHGQYNTYLKLLKANGVIDNNLNWTFGKGHLVVLGDIFDRGDKVTEVQWHLFYLEKQAAKAGGMVHVLLGNHDVMVLHGYLKYIHEKYKKEEIITNTRYFDLYSENSLLGKWLRSKPVAISINDVLMVHSGVSMECVRKNLNIAKINQLFSDSIVRKDLPSVYAMNKGLKFLNGENGPLWYRGYFEDSTFCETKLDTIMNFYATKHIVVGHTTYDEIKSLYNTKIFGIDTGIGYRQNGEVLIYKSGTFYKGSISGKRIKL
jgi:hypothetical protein